MRTSTAGIDLIKRNEGCRLTAYLDTVADPPVWTIGYGCTGPGIGSGMTISQAQADQILADRLAGEFESGVLKALQGTPTSQAQFDAMVSLAYNIGVGAFARSTVVRRHRAGDYAGAADAFLLWDKAGGKVLSALERRRTEERALYLSGKPDQPASVEDVQRRLNELGYGLVVDGDAGPLTCDALLDALSDDPPTS